MLLSQARLAARNGVSLDTVLRRYFAGFTLFGDYVMEEAEDVGLPKGLSPQGILAAEAAHFDRLIEAVSEEHTKERERRFRTPQQRQTERVRRLLAGEEQEAEKLGYDLDAWHLAAIAIGKDAPAALHNLAAATNGRLLLVRPGEEVSWAWLGGREPLDAAALAKKTAAEGPPGALLCLGEPAQGLAGWRFSHRQAKAAIPIAQRHGEGVFRYAEVCLLASALRDEVLVDSLRRLYLDPLAAAPDGGESLRETLRAYLASGRNVSSTAASLGVSRRTVAKRLRAIEERFGRPFGTNTADIEIALGLGELGLGARASPAAQS